MQYARNPTYVGIATRHWTIASACRTGEKGHEIERRFHDHVDRSPAVNVLHGDVILDDGPAANTLAQIAVGTLARRVRHVLMVVRWFARLAFAGASGTRLG